MAVSVAVGVAVATVVTLFGVPAAYLVLHDMHCFYRPGLDQTRPPGGP
jgi:hypothetical protein